MSGEQLAKGALWILLYRAVLTVLVGLAVTAAWGADGRLAAIESGLGVLAMQMGEFRAQAEGDRDDHEQRLRTLVRWHWQRLPSGAGLGR